jgi:hypothetical protein
MSSQPMTYAAALAPLRGWPNTRMPYFTRLEPLSGAKNIAHGASRGLHATKKGNSPEAAKDTDDACNTRRARYAFRPVGARFYPAFAHGLRRGLHS